MDDNDIEIVNYQSVVEATVMDAARIDVRDLTERWVRERITEHCQRNGLELAGPILIDWTCRGAARTRAVSA